jgi:hypothetical protein
MTNWILFTVLCMALQTNHCYVVSADGTPFATKAECENAIPERQEWFWAVYRAAEPHRSARPEASWCELKNW